MMSGEEKVPTLASYLKLDVNGPATKRNRHFIFTNHTDTYRQTKLHRGGGLFYTPSIQVHTGRILGCDWTLKNGGIPDIIEAFVN